MGLLPMLLCLSAPCSSVRMRPTLNESGRFCLVAGGSNSGAPIYRWKSEAIPHPSRQVPSLSSIPYVVSTLWHLRSIPPVFSLTSSLCTCLQLPGLWDNLAYVIASKNRQANGSDVVCELQCTRILSHTVCREVVIEAERDEGYKNGWLWMDG